MAPRIPQDPVDDSPSPSVTSDDTSEAGAGAKQQVEEFHTDDSDVSTSDDEEPAPGEEYHAEDSEDEDIEDDEQPQKAAPYLPEHLLRPLPSPAQSGQAAHIPWEQLTRAQKATRRRKERHSKGRLLERLQRDAKGSGVLEAGKAAQARRGIVGTMTAARNKVKSGRVEKKAKVAVSGRQRILENRKRVVQQGTGQMTRPAKKAKAKNGSKR